MIFAMLLCLVVVKADTNVSSMELDNFNSGYDGWKLSDRSWQRKSVRTLKEQYPTEMGNSPPFEANMDKNIVLVPFPNSVNSSEWIASTMTRDLALPAQGELEILFSVLLVGWNTSLLDKDQPANEKGCSLNPRLQIFYDEDMVFDISTAVSQHKSHYTWGSWNQFKMFSHYREDVNITVTVVGSTGAPSDDGHIGLVLLDDIVITIKNEDKLLNATNSLNAPRLEPEAELKENGTWTRIDTEANEEAQAEEKDADRGRPTFCSLLPEIGPCSMKKKRYFFNASSETCEEFPYGGCKGNENRFSDLVSCQLICKDRKLVEPIRSTIRSEEFTTFENGFDGWDAHSWAKLSYDSNVARGIRVGSPPQLSVKAEENEIGIMPEYHMFDFRQPQLVQEFQIGPESMLIIEFHLIVKGMGNSGFLSFFLKLDPGFNIYVGNIKVYDFKQHGFNDEHWHRYRLTMNKTEVQEHRKESGDEFLLVTIKGWLGSGRKGAVVLDNLNVTHMKENDIILADTTGSSSSATTHQSSHPGCLLDKDKGGCSAKFTRFYYSLTADACIQFTWSGCGGNANNHATEEDCLDECTGSGRTTLKTEEELKNPEEVCAMAAYTGNCKAKFDRFYFDPKSGKCQSFVYGGCKGNGNNFRSLQECQEFCKSVMSEQERNYSPTIRAVSDCVLKPDRGSCFGNISMFYFDATSTSCLPFQYGGCLGNGNRFSKISECEAFCSFVTPAPTLGPDHSNEDTTVYPVVRPTWPPAGFNESVCGLNPDQGNCKEYKTRYFYSPKEEMCKVFNWGGCGGNGNRFVSQSQCFQACQPEEEDFQETASPPQSREDDDEDEDPEDGFYSLPVFLPFPLKPDNSPSEVCKTSYDEGPCRPIDPACFLRRYYHNQTTGSCELFFYGGCGGNHNNFENKTDCQTFCGVAAEEVKKNRTRNILVVVEPFNKSSCLTAPRHGSCHLSEPRWFFSHWDNICKPYNYSGCGGNENNFKTEEVCEDRCPPIIYSGSEPRCERLRNRGQCTVRSERYFFDNVVKKCVKFGGCSNINKDENNFESRQECSQGCLGISVPSPELRSNINPHKMSQLSVSPEMEPLPTSGAKAATVVVEVLLVVILLGLTGFAVFLGWKHYSLRRGADTYRLFNDQRSNSVVSVTSGTVASYDNPVYQSELLDQINRRDSCIEIPALTLGNLGSKQTVNENEDSFA